MHKLLVVLTKSKGFFKHRIADFLSFINFFFFYIRKHVLTWVVFLETKKNVLMKFVMMKRGRYSRPFLHAVTIGVLIIGMIIAPMLTDTYPLLSSKVSAVSALPSPAAEKQSITVDDNVLQTQESSKPRDQIITYTVGPGDTLSTIAKKFDISVDTIKWANDLTSDDLSVGQEVKLLPVTGVVHKVAKGDTIYSIAKKYNTEPQGIADFPFNQFANPETFSLVEGQMLIVPNGVMPSSKPTYIANQPQSQVFHGPIGVSSGGFFFPVPGGGISQYAAWYHMALDITSPFGTPIYAAHSGTISTVSVGTYDYGYGNNVWIDDGDGIKTHYAHMSEVDVSSGQQVIGGKTIIGHIGLTGRTTGAHVHFEIQRNGVLVNPLPFVQ